jgi:glyoxylase I family protein
VIEVTGIDHIYLNVRDLEVSERFYDQLLCNTLGFRKNHFEFNATAHINYFNRHFGFVLRPAKSHLAHDPLAPGLQHFCLRVETIAQVHRVAEQLCIAGIAASPATLYPQYAADYCATHIHDPDGIHLEVTNYRQERRERNLHWLPD